MLATAVISDVDVCVCVCVNNEWRKDKFENVNENEYDKILLF